MLLLVDQAVADILHGRVVRIADGDTVTVLDATNRQWKIRLMGIDAPEKKQAFGQKSKAHLSDLVFNKQVDIEFNKKDTDKLKDRTGITRPWSPAVKHSDSVAIGRYYGPAR